MMIRAAILLALVWGTWASHPVQAQTTLTGYVLASAGYGSLADEEGGLGSGAAIGGAVGLPLTDSLGLELALTRARHERTGSLSWVGRPTTVTGRIVYRFASSQRRSRFLIAGGLGYFHYTGVFSETVYLTTNVPSILQHPWRITGTAIDAGAGVEIRPSGRLILRPEVWLTIGRGPARPNPEPPFVMPRAALSAGVRF